MTKACRGVVKSPAQISMARAETFSYRDRPALCGQRRMFLSAEFVFGHSHLHTPRVCAQSRMVVRAEFLLGHPHLHAAQSSCVRRVLIRTRTYKPMHAPFRFRTFFDLQVGVLRSRPTAGWRNARLLTSQLRPAEDCGVKRFLSGGF